MCSQSDSPDQHDPPTPRAPAIAEFYSGQRRADDLDVLFDQLQATFDLMTPDGWDDEDVRHGIAQGVWFAMTGIKRMQGDYDWPGPAAIRAEASR